MRTYSDSVLADNLMIDSSNHPYICVCNLVEITRYDFSIQVLLYPIYCYDLIIYKIYSLPLLASISPWQESCYWSKHKKKNKRLWLLFITMWKKSTGASEERPGTPLVGCLISMVEQADKYLTCLRRELRGIAGAPHLSGLYLPVFKICGDPAIQSINF